MFFHFNLIQSEARKRYTFLTKNQRAFVAPKAFHQPPKATEKNSPCLLTAPPADGAALVLPGNTKNNCNNKFSSSSSSSSRSSGQSRRKSWMALETYDADQKKKIIVKQMLKMKKKATATTTTTPNTSNSSNHHLPSGKGDEAEEDGQRGGNGNGGGRDRVGPHRRPCPISEARHLLLSLSIADYERQKERLLRLILKHTEEDRLCPHPDLVREEDGEQTGRDGEDWEEEPPTLEPPDELASLAAAADHDHGQNHHHLQDQQQPEPRNYQQHDHHHPASAIIINDEVQELLKKAFVTSLTPSQQQLVLAAMRDDLHSLHPFTIGLTPERFPELVENNPVIATEILLLFMKASLLSNTANTTNSSTSEEGSEQSSSLKTPSTSSSSSSTANTLTSLTKAAASKDAKESSSEGGRGGGGTLPEVSGATITDYFAVLVNMEVSVHSLEVVNRLTTTVELPSEFLHNYVSNCIQTCFNYKEKYMQNRLVRLVCVFLQSIIRRKIIDLKAIFLEVESFCVDFSRIREAAALFRLMKQISSGGGGGGGEMEAFSLGTSSPNNNISIPTGSDHHHQAEKPSTSTTSSSTAPSTSSPSTSTSPSLFGES